MNMPKQLLSMYNGQVCEFCPFNNMRLITEHGTTKELKKYPLSTKCAAGYSRSEQDTVFVDIGDGKKQTFVKRPQGCINENGE
jgi:hypothetical protein